VDLIGAFVASAGGTVAAEGIHPGWRGSGNERGGGRPVAED
jgi:hypothetical protein